MPDPTSFMRHVRKKFASYDRSGGLCGCAGLFGINAKRTYLQRIRDNEPSQFDKWQNLLADSKSDADTYYQLLVIQNSLSTKGSLSKIVSQLIQDAQNKKCARHGIMVATIKFRKYLIKQYVGGTDGVVNLPKVQSLMWHLCMEQTCINNQSGSAFRPPTRDMLEGTDIDKLVDLIHTKFSEVSSDIKRLSDGGSVPVKTLDDGTSVVITVESFEQNFRAKLANKKKTVVQRDGNLPAAMRNTRFGNC